MKQTNENRLEQKIKELGIEKLLVVDDMSENIEAAQNYFSILKNVEINYAKSAKEAIEKIKEAYPNRSYDFIVSDLEMETKRSGIEVVKEGYKHQSQVFIATGFAGDGSHGPSVSVHPYLGGPEGKKNEARVWNTIVNNILDYLGTKGLPQNNLLILRGNCIIPFWKAWDVFNI